MKLKQFQQSLYAKKVGVDIKCQTQAYGCHLYETVDGQVFVNGMLTKWSSLEEAKHQIKQIKIQEDIQKEIQQELYEEMSYSKIAEIIRNHHNVKITDTLVESYVELASSKIFTADPVAQDIRKFNKLDRIVEGKIEYKLNDGSIVAIDECTQDLINNVFGQHTDVIEYMRENKDNFLDVINQIEG